jgi:arylsulfatase B
MPPHVLFLLADDLGYYGLGFRRRGGSAQAAAELATPALDALADQGIVLERHYAYKICSPSRCALQSGRLPVHVNTGNTAPTVRNPADDEAGYAGIPRSMTGFAAKLRDVGYRTAFVGKWDAGMATPDHSPEGRGYESALFYWHHANNYYTCGVEFKATAELNVCLNGFADLFETNETYRGGYRGLGALLAASSGGSRSGGVGAFGDGGDDESGYEELLFRRRGVGLIQRHNASTPLLLTYAFHLLHTPLQVPRRYVRAADARVAAAGAAPFDSHTRRMIAAMSSHMDETVGELVGALKRRGMWANALVIFVSDNGGPLYEPGGNSNFPLKGGKYSDWEGGVRTSAFVSGGLIPPPRRGTAFDGVVSIADWYATLCELAGADPTDHAALAANARRAGRGLPLLPPVDGVPQWAHLMSGANGRAGALHLSAQAVLRWPYKLVVGRQAYSRWGGALYPNCSTVATLVAGGGPWGGVDLKAYGEHLPISRDPVEVDRVSWVHDCGEGGCLHNVRDDPTEQVDLAQSDSLEHQLLAAELRERLARLNERLFEPDRGAEQLLACDTAILNGGFYGPFVETAGWYTEPLAAAAAASGFGGGEAALPTGAALHSAALHFFASWRREIVHGAKVVLPLVVGPLSATFDSCEALRRPLPFGPGGDKLDQVMIPLMIIVAFALWSWPIALVVGLLCAANIVACCCPSCLPEPGSRGRRGRRGAPRLLL